MKVAVRTDASLRIGTGHLARCLTLAKRLQEEGALVTFVCRGLEGQLCDELIAQGFELHRLPSPSAPPPSSGDDDYPKWLGVPLETDAAETSARLESERFDWLIVDHYSITASWHRALRPRVDRILVIDDLAEARMECDLLLNQSVIDAPNDLYEQTTASGCVTLLGPAYALLRPEFAELRSAPRTNTAPARKLLISFGGVDAANLSSRSLEALAPELSSRWSVEVALGPANPHAEELARNYGAETGVEILQEVSDLALRMTNADLAIGAGGVSAWERCCAGLPSVMISAAPNQVGICEGIARSGAGRYLGTAAEVDPASISRAVSELSEEPEAMAEMSRAARALVDGRGVERVVRKMRCVAQGKREG